MNECALRAMSNINMKRDVSSLSLFFWTEEWLNGGPQDLRTKKTSKRKGPFLEPRRVLKLRKSSSLRKGPTHHHWKGERS